MWLYNRRLVELAKSFDEVRERFSELHKKLSDKKSTPDPKAIKLELDILTGQLRILKEETTYFLKLGAVYDMARFHEEFIAELQMLDPDAAIALLERLDERWRAHEGNETNTE